MGLLCGMHNVSQQLILIPGVAITCYCAASRRSRRDAVVKNEISLDISSPSSSSSSLSSLSTRLRGPHMNEEDFMKRQRFLQRTRFGWV